LILLLGIVVFSSCSVTRNLDQDQYLLKANHVVFDTLNPGIDTDELNAILQPQPNKRFLGIVPFKIWFYNMGVRGKQESGFRTWLREKVGSRPVIFNEGQAESSVKNLENYLAKIGYFNSHVDYSMSRKKKKARVTYFISPSEPYRIRNIDFIVEDTVLSSIMRYDPALSKLREGMIFNAFELDEERDRIAAILQNNGYYYFDKNYIFYEIDSSLRSQRMDLRIKVKDYRPTMNQDSLEGHYFKHYRYKINKVFIKTDYDSQLETQLTPDTLLFAVKQNNPARLPIPYRFIYLNKLKIRPLTVTQSLFMKEGDPYSARDVRMSKIRLSEIGLYGYSNIRFREVSEGDSTGFGELDCYVDLGRKKLHSFTVEAEGTNRGGRPGVGLNFSYQNKNIFRGSEILQLRAHIALEAQKNLTTSGEDVTGNIPFFNSIETGFEVSVRFPRFLIPIAQHRFPKYFRPKTTIRTGFGYDRRPEYTRSPIFLSFGYDWKESETKRHMINPFDWNIVDVNLSPDFKEIIDNEPNDRIRNQYTDHLITALSYSFIFNNQDIKKLQNFIYFRGDVETGGNLLYLGYSLFGRKADTLNYYTLNGIRFSQYARMGLDFRYYNVVSQSTTVAYRVFIGVGLPYGNANVLPLEKGFYGGGSNGMRGWPLRRLGPGSYSNPEDYFDKMGDIHLEANIEYRLPVYKFFKLGLFIDMGNIWLIQDNESYPGGAFKFDKFYNDFAIDVGLGIRLDFNFFILRMDAAIPLRDPALPEKQRWTINYWQFKDVLLNFGIGYPF
jgi:outer membrane protein assembly factor BamA